MYLLPCPSCQSSIPLAPSQAGNETTCPACQATVTVPKLGVLRQLPQTQEENKDRGQGVPISTGRSMGFVILGLIAAAAILVAGYCGIRWSLIKVSTTTEQHIADYREAYQSLTAAELIREYEQMETDKLELMGPTQYKRDQLEKHAWGRNASIAAAVAGVALLAAFGVAGLGSRDRSA